ncbi:MAG: AbrB/MazE/SpoVT family DNA-binding domain-containing protein [Nitrososphaerota archaeon]|jgi:AbrB family looped-hinge helix DNA binding protein|nr:AbrB/MazE/SpoVT family DNA-binding domain-containing protein [Nitrososphaerota archaeon]MDG6919806.1 AbrB/MazE/SpoVT family DNA-binding domain-containing protein [Nitrososphaerota archaeon]MDG6976959.1 AbrB/MazE/SpoVT family DNA-binding domain-containing protein [Nitrososphaerota archaeon]MDG6989784.1 AbrB/MazE/SpoVT family DNA-binding domain-containing protein [Nitrososphaerota archaeon]MDG6993224.1 AbrB/MazE/SpoVT family DNA-binding domain-containing protein [Nitrososphaerota archaeon]
MAKQSVVGPKGQITLPKEMREHYHLLEGEEVVLVEEAEGVLVRHRPAGLRGRFRGRMDLNGLDRDVRELREKWTL